MLTKRSTKPRQKQLEFSGAGFIKPGYEFGGSTLKSNPKGKRPLSTKLPIHLTLRARRSVLRLPKTYKFVSQEIERVAKKHGIKIYRFANVGNHLHLLIRVGRIPAWARFIRELTGRIAQGLALLQVEVKDFWMYRPHTRVASNWGRAFKTLCEYIKLNQWEGRGVISRRDFKGTRDLREFLDLVQGVT